VFRLAKGFALSSAFRFASLTLRKQITFQAVPAFFQIAALPNAQKRIAFQAIHFYSKLSALQNYLGGERLKSRPLIRRAGAAPLFSSRWEAIETPSLLRVRPALQNACHPERRLKEPKSKDLAAACNKILRFRAGALHSG